MSAGFRIGGQQNAGLSGGLRAPAGQGTEGQLAQLKQQDPRIEEFLKNNPEVEAMLKNNPALLRQLLGNPDALEALQGLASMAKQAQPQPQAGGQSGGGPQKAEGAGGAKGNQGSGGAAEPPKSLEELLAELMKDGDKRKKIMEQLEAAGKLTPELKAALGGAGGESGAPTPGVATVASVSTGGGGGASLGA